MAARNDSQLTKIMQRLDENYDSSSETSDYYSQRVESSTVQYDYDSNSGSNAPSESGDSCSHVVEAVNTNHTRLFEIMQRFNRDNVIADTTDSEDSKCSKACNGGQLYKICKKFEEPSFSSENQIKFCVEEVPCPVGNVKSLRAQLSPKLFRDKRLRSSNTSVNSVLSRESSNLYAGSSCYSQMDRNIYENNEDYAYANVQPTIKRNSRYVNESVLNRYNEKNKHIRRHISNASSNASSRPASDITDSSIYEDYEVVDICENNVCVKLCEMTEDMNLRKVTDHDSDSSGENVYEDVDMQLKKVVEQPEPVETTPSSAITDAELGYEEDGPAGGSMTVTAFNVALHIEETESKKAKRRLKDAINELIQTEKKYINDMKHVIEDYIPMLASKNIPASENFTKSNIFGNIEDIYKFHLITFLPELMKNRRNLKRLAKMFIDYEIVFDMYIHYSSNNKNSNGIIFENKPFFEKKRLETERSLDLSSYLLSPVQRLPRYLLFIEELIKSYKRYIAASDVISRSNICYSSDDNCEEDQSDSNGTELDILEMARDAVKRVLKTTNDRIAITNVHNCPINLLNLKLLCHDQFTGTDSNMKRSWPMRCFLFEELLLLTTIEITNSRGEIYRYHDSIETSKLGITPSDSHIIDKLCVWSEHRINKNYLLYASPKVMKIWFDSIIGMLWKDAINKKGFGSIRTSGKIAKHKSKRRRTTWYI